MVRALLEHYDIDVKLQAEFGSTALHGAAREGHVDVV